MKENKDMPAAPVLPHSFAHGLTKREAFAMHAMEGMLARSKTYSDTFIADEAIKCADALLQALEDKK